MKAETTDKETTSTSSSRASDFNAAAKPTRPFLNIKAHESSKTEPTTDNTFHLPVHQTTRESHPSQNVLPANPQNDNHDPFKDIIMQTNQTSTSKPRKNPVRKTKSISCIFCGDKGYFSRKRNITSSIVSRNKRYKALENLPPSRKTAPDLLNPAIIPEVIDKLFIQNLPQLPDFPAIHVPKAAKLHMPELPKLNLPEIPKMPVPEVPRQFVSEIAKLGIPEIPKMALSDFYKIFNIYRGSMSAPVFSHVSMKNKEEREVTAESSAATMGSSDSPSLETWEWED